jgi:DegV family protein with EDD domain
MGGSSAGAARSTGVQVVTDSTAVLPAEVVAAAGLRVVPLTVSISGEQGLEGIEVSPEDVARALGERRHAVTTSRPAPAEFAEVYRELLTDGATGIVSIHISSRLSGTYESALLAAEEFEGRVVVVDSLTAGSGVGFIALAAAAAARGASDPEEARQAALTAAGKIETFFYVDTLEYLRRGGRISAASALVGTALAVKPILNVERGEVVLKEKVRTAGRALARMVELAIDAAGESDVDIAVQHLAAQERAEALLAQLRAELGPRLGDSFLAEVGAVIGAHTGPGCIGVTVHRRS